MRGINLASFADELVKTADRAAMQGMIDSKLAPFKPPAPSPVLGPTAAPAPAFTPKPLDQKMQESFSAIRNKASAASQGLPKIKTPRTLLGTRG